MVGLSLQAIYLMLLAITLMCCSALVHYTLLEAQTEEKFVTTSVPVVILRFDLIKKRMVFDKMIFFVPNADSFPCQFLNWSDGGTSPHRELCTQPESKVIKHPFIVLNHPFFW